MRQYLSKYFYRFSPSITNLIFDKRISGEDKEENQISVLEGLNLNDLEVKIKVYEDRVIGWFLDFAKKLSNEERDAGFIVLHISIAYIEGNQQFREGKLSKGTSTANFIKGVRRIFDKAHVPEEILKKYYQQIRCGLFHDGITKRDVSISGEYFDPLNYDNKKILINPHKFLSKVIEDFRGYIEELKFNQESRANFEKRWNLEIKNS